MQVFALQMVFTNTDCLQMCIFVYITCLNLKKNITNVAKLWKLKKNFDFFTSSILEASQWMYHSRFSLDINKKKRLPQANNNKTSPLKNSTLCNKRTEFYPN